MRCLSSLAALFLFLGLAATTDATPRVYRLGLDALEAKDFATAEQFFREALERDTSPGLMYHPYFYLGVALQRQGDCAGALAEWRISEQRRRLPRKLSLELRSYRRFCLESADIKEINAEAEEVLRLAQEVADQVRDKAEDPTLAGAWRGGTASRDPRFEEMLGLQARAERNLKEAQRPPWRVKEATAAMEAAERFLEQVEGLYQDLNAYRPPEPPPRISDAGKGGLGGGRGSGVDGGTRSEGERSDRESTTGGTLTGEGGTEGGSTGSGTLSLVEASPGGPPQLLLEAAEALFAGNYGAALETLEGKEFSDPRANAHAYLFRSAAHYALHLSGLDDGVDHLRYAEAYAAAAQQAHPSLRPLAQVFSPRFRNFFQGDR